MMGMEMNEHRFDEDGEVEEPEPEKRGPIRYDPIEGMYVNRITNEAHEDKEVLEKRWEEQKESGEY